MTYRIGNPIRCPAANGDDELGIDDGSPPVKPSVRMPMECRALQESMATSILKPVGPLVGTQQWGQASCTRVGPANDR